MAELCDPVEEGVAGAVDVLEMEEGEGAALVVAAGALEVEVEEEAVGVEATDKDRSEEHTSELQSLTCIAYGGMEGKIGRASCRERVSRSV